MSRRKARLYLGNLPEHSSENDVVKRLKKFGTVDSVEIKQKREADSETVASTFAFVNIEADHYSLQQCLEELRSSDWDGSYIKAELAKESFLDRLQRERNEAAKSTSLDKVQNKQDFSESHCNNTAPLAVKTENVPRKRKTSFKDESDLCKEDELVSKLESFSDFWKDDEPARLHRPLKKERSSINHDLHLNHSSNSYHLKDGFSKSRRLNDTEEQDEKSTGSPDSFKAKPQISNNSKFNSEDTIATVSEMKRLRALEEKSKAFKQQKDAIKLALSSVDVAKPSNKVIFDDNGDPVSAPVLQTKVSSNRNSKKNEKTTLNNFSNNRDFSSKEVNKTRHLFDEDDEADTWQGDFSFKKQFEGKKGKKLLAMQARFKDDERFAIDERFAESDDESEEDETPENAVTEEEKKLREEKAKEMEILASVMGEPVQKSVSKKSVFNPMIRFDPLKPSHAKFELPKPNDAKLKSVDIDSKKAGKSGKDRVSGSAEVESEPLPVDDKQFYKVATYIRDLFRKDEKQTPSEDTTTFSLRQMFSSAHEDNERGEEIEASQETLKESRPTPRASARPILRGFQDSKPLAMFTKKVLRPNLDGMTNTFCKDVDVEEITKKFSEKRRVLGRMLHKKKVVLERQQHFKQKIGVASSAHKSFQGGSGPRRKSSKPWERKRGKR